MSNTIALVSSISILVLIATLVIGYYAVIASDKKAAAKKIADKIAADKIASDLANKQGWADLNEVIRVITTDLHWLASNAGLRDLHAAINANAISNMRLGQVTGSNMSNHNGLGIYMTMNGQEVAYGIKANHTNQISLVSGVCRIYGE
jgi:hypothetical protein